MQNHIVLLQKLATETKQKLATETQNTSANGIE